VVCCCSIDLLAAPEDVFRNHAVSQVENKEKIVVVEALALVADNPLEEDNDGGDDGDDTNTDWKRRRVRRGVCGC